MLKNRLKKTHLILIAFLLVFFSINTIAESISSVQAVAAHNNVRTKVNNGNYSNQPIAKPSLLDLVWDPNLADSAQLYANQCIWQHSSNRIHTGENLYVAASSNSEQVFTIEQAVDSWAGEFVDYDFNNNSCGANKMCGHYTQLVWQDTLQVGCAAAQCNPIKAPDGSSLFSSDFPFSTYIVCQYGPAGNLTGVPPYETEGSDSTLLSQYDFSTQVLEVPYLLFHQTDSNFVVAYKASFKLFSSDPIVLKLTNVTKVNYLDLFYSDSYDQNTRQLFLSNMQLYNQGVLQSSHASVLKFVSGSADLLELKSFR
ncbi:MAG: CAP family protein [Pseudomonadota bacterium]